jgi:hypothetical protein
MAIPDLIRPLAAAVDDADATAELRLRRMRAALLIKENKRGVRPTLEATDLGLYIITAGGGDPMQGVSMAPGFANAEYLCSPGAGEDQHPRLGPGNLLSIITCAIEKCARRAQAVDDGQIPEWAEHALLPPFPAVFNFKLSPLLVELVWFKSNGAWERTDVYAPPRFDRPADPTRTGQPWRYIRLVRSTTIPIPVIAVAGRILWDERRRGGGGPLQAPNGAPASADASGMENAETPPARDGSAPTRTKDRSRNGENRGLQHPHTMQARSLSQERASPSGGHPVPLSKWKDPPCPTATNTTTT